MPLIFFFAIDIHSKKSTEFEEWPIIICKRNREWIPIVVSDFQNKSVFLLLPGRMICANLLCSCFSNNISFLIVFTIQIRANMGNCIKLVLYTNKTSTAIMNTHSAQPGIKARKVESIQKSLSEHNFRVCSF